MKFSLAFLIGSIARAQLELPDSAPITSQHRISVGGKTLAYTARAGYFPLYDDLRELKARIFYVARTLNQPENGPRPLTFAWNGGPGSPASTVHLALMGPRRAKTLDEYKIAPPPYELVDNQDPGCPLPIWCWWTRSVRLQLRDRARIPEGFLEPFGRYRFD